MLVFFVSADNVPRICAVRAANWMSLALHRLLGCWSLRCTSPYSMLRLRLWTSHPGSRLRHALIANRMSWAWINCLTMRSSGRSSWLLEYGSWLSVANRMSWPLIDNRWILKNHRHLRGLIAYWMSQAKVHNRRHSALNDRRRLRYHEWNSNRTSWPLIDNRWILNNERNVCLLDAYWMSRPRIMDNRRIDTCCRPS